MPVRFATFIGWVRSCNDGSEKEARAVSCTAWVVETSGTWRTDCWVCSVLSAKSTTLICSIMKHEAKRPGLFANATKPNNVHYHHWGFRSSYDETYKLFVKEGR